ncbi:MAG: hypothetical protein IKV41_06145 [Oscillospiraceae bacterium]|nr:hypothetical protein [Oscillospiraceae bacterium]
MRDIDKILELIAQKEEFFRRYEEETNKLVVSAPDEWEKFLRIRQGIIDQIQALDKKIELILLNFEKEYAAQIVQALKVACSRSELPEELLPVFDASQKICAYAHRAQRAEYIMADRIESEMENLSEKIKQTNRSVDAKAAKYNVGFSSYSANGFLRGKA